MMLLTKEIENNLSANPLGSHDGEGMKARVIVKFFNPVGPGTWLITEGSKEGNDWMLFGYCCISDAEWGYVSLNELKSVKLPFGLSIERDMYLSGKETVGDLSKSF